MPGDVVSEGHVYLTLKDNPSIRRDLAGIRDDIAAVYEMREGSLPSRTALADAMTVLRGKARKAAPDEETAGDAAAGLLAANGLTADLTGWDSSDAASSYKVRDGALGWHRPVKDGGTAWTPLATFDATIITETIRDDGAEQVLTWALRVTAKDGRGGDIEIPRPARQAAAVGGQAGHRRPAADPAPRGRVRGLWRKGDGRACAPLDA